MLTYDDLLNIGLAPDVQAFERLLVSAAGELGYALAAGALIRGRFASGRSVVRPFGNPPAAFVEESRAVDVAARDPVLTHLLAQPGLLAYDQRFYLDRAAAELWDVQAPFGYREGMALSLHEVAHAEVFTFGVDGEALPSKLEDRYRLEADLRLICAHAQHAARRLYFPEVAAASVQLERHEAEVLQWAADGVSVWVTGDKMRISSQGVAHLLGEGQRKLGASSRHGAVLKAIEGGLIER